MRGRQPHHVADTSPQPLHEQRVVPFQFDGWHGLLVQDFPVFFPGQEEILYEVSQRGVALIPIAEHGTLLVSLTRGYDPSHGLLPNLIAQAVLFTADPLERSAVRVTASDKWAALEQACMYFTLLSREEGTEKIGVLWEAAMQGMLQCNVCYRLPFRTPRLGKYTDTGQKAPPKPHTRRLGSPEPLSILAYSAKNGIRKRSHVMKGGNHFFNPTPFLCWYYSLLHQ